MSKRDLSDRRQSSRDFGGGRENWIACQRSVTTHEWADCGTSFVQDRKGRRHIPQIDVEFDVSVGAASCDISKAEGARAGKTRHGAGGDNAIGERKESFLRKRSRCSSNG